MVAPITTEPGEGGGNGIMIKVTRSGGSYGARIVSFVSIYPCSSARDPRLEPIVAKAMRSRKLLRLHSVRVDRHAPTDTCLVHGPTVCLSEQSPAPADSVRPSNPLS